MKYGVVVITAGFSGLLSFSFLAVAIDSDYWYIIDASSANYSDLQERSSHSGLWRILEGRDATSIQIHSFYMDTSNNTDLEKQLINSHKVIVTLLPLSLVLLVFGGICGLVSSLSRNPSLLTGSASYFLFCSPIPLDPSMLATPQQVLDV